jgi:hypothetical protein
MTTMQQHPTSRATIIYCSINCSHGILNFRGEGMCSTLNHLLETTKYKLRTFSSVDKNCKAKEG